jgi:hypothetical protein
VVVVDVVVDDEDIDDGNMRKVSSHLRLTP